jgi:hypothetical protein
MNDTTTSRYLTTIVAIFMAATLVIGIGTLAATTNNAFAYQKKKGPQDNGNDDNSNGNLVTIQKCKQDGTQGGTQCNAIEM